MPSLATALNMTRVGLYKALKSKYITVDRVVAISRILNHNFFDDYFPASVIPGSNSLKISSEITQLRAENKKLATELNSLREIISIFKSRTETS
jgi:hypothetical protein